MNPVEKTVSTPWQVSMIWTSNLALYVNPALPRWLRRCPRGVYWARAVGVIVHSDGAAALIQDIRDTTRAAAVAWRSKSQRRRRAWGREILIIPVPRKTTGYMAIRSVSFQIAAEEQRYRDLRQGGGPGPGARVGLHAGDGFSVDGRPGWPPAALGLKKLALFGGQSCHGSPLWARCWGCCWAWWRRSAGWGSALLRVVCHHRAFPAHGRGRFKPADSDWRRRRSSVESSGNRINLSTR